MAIVAIATLFIIVTFAIYGYGASIHGDEYFSIGFANNTEEFLFVTQGNIDKCGTDGWLIGNFYMTSVQPGEGFAIMSIHRNVRQDVHPYVRTFAHTVFDLPIFAYGDARKNFQYTCMFIKVASILYVPVF